MSSVAGVAGTVAIVSGAAGGIGRAVVAALGDAGATAVGFDRVAGHDPSGTNSTRGAGDAGYTDTACHRLVDVADAAAVDAAVAEVEADVGPVEILVNAAGVLRMGALVDLGDDDWLDTWSTNVAGVLHLTRSVGRRMAARGSGRIVTVASDAATLPRVGMGAYAASKAAAAMLTRVFGLELAGRGVRCNIVSPGATDTPMQRALWTDDEEASRAAVIAGSPERFRGAIPLGRIAEPADVAAAVLFLVSDAARHVTLHDLRVDGGGGLGR